MKRSRVLILCIAIIFASPIPVRAENGTGAAALGFSVDFGEPVWEAVAILPPFDIILATRDRQPIQLVKLPVQIENQFGGQESRNLPVRFEGAPFDTSVCGDFEIYVTVSVSSVDDIRFANAEYTLPVTLRVTDPIQHLFNGWGDIASVSGGYSMRAFYAEPIDAWGDVLLEVSLDDRESWQNARETFTVDFQSEYIDIETLEEGVCYWFRLTVMIDGLAVTDTLPVTITGDATDYDNSVWDVTGVLPPDDTILIIRGREATLPEELHVNVQNQFGQSGTFLLPVRWTDVPYDTSTCGDFTIGATFSTVNLPDWAGTAIYTREEYIFPVTLRVTDPIPPDLLNCDLNIYPFWRGGHIVEAYYPVSLDWQDECLLEFSLDEGKSWQDAWDPLWVGYYENFLDMVLEENVTYYFRLTVTGNGLVQGTSDIMVLKIEDGTVGVWDENGHRYGGGQGVQPELPPAPPVLLVPPDNPDDTPVTPADSSATTASSPKRAGGDPGESASGGDNNSQPADQDDIRSQAEAETTDPVSGAQPIPVLAATPLSEQNGVDFVTLSGKRLAVLMESGTGIPFVKHGVQILMTSELLYSLKIAEDSLFTVIIEKPDRNTLRLAFNVDGLDLTDPFDFPFDIFFPYVPEPDESTDILVCADSMSGYIPALYNEHDKRLSFSLKAGGKYTISQAAKPQPDIAAYSSVYQLQTAETPQPVPPGSKPKSKAALPVAAVICAPIASVFILKWRLKRIG